MSLKNLAQQALDVQNACNLIAILGGAQQAAKQLRELCPELSSYDLARHPIMQLWADKIASLAGTQYSALTDLDKSYRAVYGMAE